MPHLHLAPDQCVSVSGHARGRDHGCAQRVPGPPRGSGRTRRIKRAERGSLISSLISDEGSQQLGELG